MKKELFADYYHRIEKAIGQSAEGKEIPESGMLKINIEMYLCARELTSYILKERIKKNPKLKGKIDDNWLTWFSLAVVAYCWASAVSRGKGYDKKRDMKGRIGWLQKHDNLPEIMSSVYKMGEEIVNDRLMTEGDFNSDAQYERFRKLWKSK